MLPYAYAGRRYRKLFGLTRRTTPIAYQPIVSSWHLIVFHSPIAAEDIRVKRIHCKRKRGRRLGENRIRWTLNVAGAASASPESVQFADHLVVLQRFVDVLGYDWMTQARRVPPWTEGRNCPDGVCRHFLCPWHLSIERNRRGSLRLTHPDTLIEDRPYTCLWKFIKDNPDGASLEIVGQQFDLHRPRIHGIWEEIRAKITPFFGNKAAWV